MHKIVFITYAGIVAVVSLLPSVNDSGGNLDKVVHLLVYYIFAVFGYRMLGNKQYYFYICLGIIIYGSLIELGQSYTPGRDMSGYDVVANIAGVALGAVVMKLRR